MPAFPRAEIQEMVDQFDQAMLQVQIKRDWTGMDRFYTDDASYGWFLGHDEEVMLVGREAIRNHTAGGLEGWTTPFVRSIIDADKAEVVCFCPYLTGQVRKNGSPYQVAGFSGSWFHYAGNFQWSWQRDFLDLGNMRMTMREMMADGVIGEDVVKRMQEAAANPVDRYSIPGHYRLGQAPVGLWEMAALP